MSAISVGRAHAKNAVAWLERQGLGAHRFHFPGEIQTQDGTARPERPGEETHEEGVRSKQAAISPRDRCCMHPDQDLVRRGSRFRDVEYLYDIR
jgi:hypothetical protein